MTEEAGSSTGASRCGRDLTGARVGGSDRDLVRRASFCSYFNFEGPIMFAPLEQDTRSLSEEKVVYGFFVTQTVIRRGKAEIT